MERGVSVRVKPPKQHVLKMPSSLQYRIYLIHPGGKEVGTHFCVLPLHMMYKRAISTCYAFYNTEHSVLHLTQQHQRHLSGFKKLAGVLVAVHLTAAKQREVRVAEEKRRVV